MDKKNPVNSESQSWALGLDAVVSVVMLGYRDARLLDRAVRSFAATASNEQVWELVLVLNGASPSVVALARQLLEENSFPLKVISLDSCRPGAARNHGVRAARAGLVLFLDDDTECYQDMVASTLATFSDNRVQAAGGANLTPPKSGALERATGSAMGSWFGAGSMRKRYLSGEEGQATEHSLILCNLALRRSIFLGQKGFATHLISNEENVLLQRLESEGALLWQSPGLSVYHRRRSCWSGLWEQSMKYGSGRAQNLLLLPKTFRAEYFLPMAFLFYLTSLPIAWAAPFWLLPGLVYLSCALGFSLSAAFWRRDSAQLLQLFVFPWVHLAYGWGMLKTLMVWTGKRKQLLDHAL